MHWEKQHAREHGKIDQVPGKVSRGKTPETTRVPSNRGKIRSNVVNGRRVPGSRGSDRGWDVLEREPGHKEMQKLVFRGGK